MSRIYSLFLLLGWLKSAMATMDELFSFPWASSFSYPFWAYSKACWLRPEIFKRRLSYTDFMAGATVEPAEVVVTGSVGRKNILLLVADFANAKGKCRI